jgi:hypothetical protein
LETRKERHRKVCPAILSFLVNPGKSDPRG